jgi:hypothetical protein
MINSGVVIMAGSRSVSIRPGPARDFGSGVERAVDGVHRAGHEAGLDVSR